jgi:hypothetical protein
MLGHRTYLGFVLEETIVSLILHSFKPNPNAYSTPSRRYLVLSAVQQAANTAAWSEVSDDAVEG